MNNSDWDSRYAAEPALWGAEPNQFVRAALAGAEPGRAIDLACGNGRNSLWLARRGWQVTGVDISAVALAQAGARCTELGLDVRWEHADVRGWSAPDPVDLVLVAYLHLPMPELTAVLAKAATMLAAGGRLFYVGHARTNLERGFGGPSDPAVLSEIADLAAAAEGLRVIALEHVLRETAAGTAIDIRLEATPWTGSTSEPVLDAHPGETRAGGR